MKKTLLVSGLKCASCEVLLEQNISKIKGVTKVKANQNKGEVVFFINSNIEQHILEKAVLSAGFKIGKEKTPWFSTNKEDYKSMVVSLFLVVLLVYMFQTLNIDRFFSFDIIEPTHLMALIIGVAAGLSTCMALTGGLVLGVAAKYSKTHIATNTAKKFVPHLYFNAGRIASFFFLGGLIGGMGSVLTISKTITGLLVIGVGVFMMFLGLQLTEIFPRLSAYKLGLPKKIGKLFRIDERKENNYSHRNAFFLGILTFILPCGFTQAMQIYAISTGSFIEGALIMSLFAIGTVPGLLGIGALTSFIKGKTFGLLFKFLGVLVMLFSLLNISNGLNVGGFNSFIFGSQGLNEKGVTYFDGKSQIIKSTYSVKDILLPSKFEVAVGKPVRFEIYANDNGEGCMGSVTLPGLENKFYTFEKGKTVVFEFIPAKAGTYNITCAMGMSSGIIIVK